MAPQCSGHGAACVPLLVGVGVACPGVGAVQASTHPEEGWHWEGIRSETSLGDHSQPMYM